LESTGDQNLLNLRIQRGLQNGILRYGSLERLRYRRRRTRGLAKSVMKIDTKLTAKKLLPLLDRVFELSGDKIRALEKSWDSSHGTPVFTVRGKYASRGWTEWTQGFQYGSALLQFDVTGEEEFLELGRRGTVQRMATHVSHIGVHDHGFNNVSTYGSLWRLIKENRITHTPAERDFCELALKVSGAVQAARWTALPLGGFIYSFNGPHSLFVDTLRSLRSLALAHKLGHVLMGERDLKISLLQRLLQHAEATATHSIYYGKGRDIYDARGRTAHESIFNLNDGSYRCPNSQQGYSPFSTWTRGLAWAILGFAEQLEFLGTLADGEPTGTNRPLAHYRNLFLEAAKATADFYIENSCKDGVPLWDTGAPNAWRLGDYLRQPSDPWNQWEPVDSSAAAIAGQGFIRLGNYLLRKGRRAEGSTYRRRFNYCGNPDDRALPFHQRKTPGPPAPFHLPQAKRLGRNTKGT
jgi:unsaturated chondroitin disaccharide hydrolase